MTFTQAMADKLFATIQDYKHAILGLFEGKRCLTLPADHDGRDTERLLAAAGFDLSSQTDPVRFKLLSSGRMMFEQGGEAGDFYETYR